MTVFCYITCITILEHFEHVWKCPQCTRLSLETSVLNYVNGNVHVLAETKLRLLHSDAATKKHAIFKSVSYRMLCWYKQ